MPYPVAACRGKGGQPQIVTPPGDWSWTLPFTITPGGVGTFGLGGWDVSAGAVSGGVSLYVATWGNDTTGVGSAANPYRSVKKAISMAATSGDTIWVEPGLYYYISSAVWSGWDGYSCRKSLNVRRWGAVGEVILSMHHGEAVWAAEDAAYHYTTATAVLSVLGCAPPRRQRRLHRPDQRRQQGRSQGHGRDLGHGRRRLLHPPLRRPRS